MIFKKLKAMFRYNKEVEVIDFDFYKSIDILGNLSHNEIKRLDDYMIHKSYKKDEIIFRENHPTVVLYIIKSGRVKVFMNTSDGETIINILESKKHFGEMGIFIDANRLASAVAIEDTELIAIQKTDLKQFIKSNPGTGIKLLFNLGKTISSELYQAYSLMK